MNHSTKLIAGALAIALASGGAGYAIGASAKPANQQAQPASVDSPTTPSAASPTDPFSDPELATLIRRSDFEALDLSGKTIYVTGHRSPDSDTVCSAIAYAKLLKELGYDAHPVVLGTINNETAFILNHAGVEVPELLEDASDQYMILVDHANVEHSALGIEDAHVLGIIDHHGSGNITTAEPIVYDAHPIGSVNTIVWMRYHDYGVTIDPQTAEVMLGGILSDTSNFNSTATTTADYEAAKELAAIAGITDVNAYYTELFKALITHEGQTDEEIFLSDMKTYEAGGTPFAVGVVNVYDEDEAKDIAERMKAVMPTELETLGVKMAFTQVAIFHDGINVSYLVGSDDAADDVLKTAFGDKATFDGTSWVLEPGGSRKKMIVPAISEVLEAHPSE